jgi:aspartyl-tRNA(Asn)/glutamyl-tRNA(Gln) amidotransferase subunit B
VVESGSFAGHDLGPGGGRSEASGWADQGERRYETVIGLEVHAQVLTRSKMYCGCSARYADAPPNTHVCPVCGGFPGALPVMNRAAIEGVILTGLALNCLIPEFSKLDRKNYVYPDLPKGYQISQYDLPLCVDGWLEFVVGGETRRAGITRVHIEEDTGRLVHRADLGGDVSLVDLNRSGVPLMEIVGEPDLRSPEEAREYLVALRQTLRAIGVSSGNMEEGAFRCDANVSVREEGGPLGSKVEIKNMNSFRAVERALRFEAERQRTVLAEGGAIPQETRGWIEAQGVTVSQRTKEQAHDYRYFPEPDPAAAARLVGDGRNDPRRVAGVAGGAALALPRGVRAGRRRGRAADDRARGVADVFEATVGERADPERASRRRTGSSTT